MVTHRTIKRFMETNKVAMKGEKYIFKSSTRRTKTSHLTLSIIQHCLNKVMI